MVLLVSCGTVEVKGLDDVVDKIGDAVDQASDATDTTDAASDNDEVTDTEGSDVWQIDTKDPPLDRFLVGTFKWVWTDRACNDFPNTVRLYTYDDQIFMDNNNDEMMSQGILREDETFDFDFLVKQWNGWEDETCSCSYIESDWYEDRFRCACDGAFICNLLYVIL